MYINVGKNRNPNKIICLKIPKLISKTYFETSNVAIDKSANRLCQKLGGSIHIPRQISSFHYSKLQK